jgi:hypothetical protein
MSIVLKFITTAPDVLGYVSSMTRDNPYVKIPPGATGIDGAARARLLRDVRVQLADVHTHDETGHIALCSVEDDGETRRGKLIRARSYK